MDMDIEEFNEVKKAYKLFYEKSKELISSPHQREMMLERAINELFMERFEKVNNDGLNFSENEKQEILSYLKVRMKEWKIEFDEEERLCKQKDRKSKKVWWKLW